jgi:hypothetical protein
MGVNIFSKSGSPVISIISDGGLMREVRQPLHNAPMILQPRTADSGT